MKIRSLIKEFCQCICSNFKTMAPAYFLVALLDIVVVKETSNYFPQGSLSYWGFILLNMFICFLVYTNMLHFLFKQTPSNLFTFHRFDLVKRGFLSFLGVVALMIIPGFILGFGVEFGQSFLNAIDYEKFFEYGASPRYRQLLMVGWGSIISGIAIGGFVGIYFMSKYSVVIPLAIVDGGKSWNKAVQLTKGFRWKIAGFKGVVILLMLLALAIKLIPYSITNDYGIGNLILDYVSWGFSTFCLLMIWTTADIVVLRNLRGM